MSPVSHLCANRLVILESCIWKNSYNFRISFLIICRIVSKSSDRFTTCTICLEPFEATRDPDSQSVLNLEVDGFSEPVAGNQSVASLRSRNSNGVLGLLPCEHVFHFCCIWEWLLYQRICPTCKAITELSSIATISESAFVEYYENKCIHQSKKQKYQHVELDSFRFRSHSDPKRPQKDKKESFQFRSRAHTTGGNLTKDMFLKKLKAKQALQKNQGGERRIYIPESQSLTQSRQNLGSIPETAQTELPTIQRDNQTILAQEVTPERGSALTLCPDVSRLRLLNLMESDYRLRTRSNVSDISVLYI